MTAFSNGFEYDCWSARWCNRCTHVDTCEILLSVMVDNVVPREWTLGHDDLFDRYHCNAFERAQREAVGHG